MTMLPRRGSHEATNQRPQQRTYWRQEETRASRFERNPPLRLAAVCGRILEWPPSLAIKPVFGDPEHFQHGRNTSYILQLEVITDQVFKDRKCAIECCQAARGCRGYRGAWRDVAWRGALAQTSSQSSSDILLQTSSSPSSDILAKSLISV